MRVGRVFDRFIFPQQADPSIGDGVAAAFGSATSGIEAAVDSYVAMTRATQRLVILTSS
jgi:hypothetical protein